MSTPDQQNVNLNDSLLAAEIEKTKLEIEALKYQRRWVSRLTTLVGAITTVLALGGLVFTFYQFEKTQAKEREERFRNETLRREEQTRERMNKIQAQIRANKELLLEFDTNNETSSTRVLFMLDDLGSLIKELPESERDQEEQEITDLLTKIAWDLGYHEGRDVEFDVLALRWAPYREYWKADPTTHHRFLFSKYYAAMKSLYARDSLCIQSLVYDPQDRLYIARGKNKRCEGGPFQALLHGYLHHLKIVSELKDPSYLEREIAEFRKLTNNPSAADSLIAAMPR